MAEEKLFENRIKRYLQSIGVYPAGHPENEMPVPPRGWYTKIWGGGFQKAGIPDILCCVNGRFVAVEVKASNGRPSELQKLNLSRINASNGIGVFLYPNGFSAFKELMEVIIGCDTHIPELTAFGSANTSSGCVIWTS